MKFLHILFLAALPLHAAPPDILLILADDFGPGDIGGQTPTPALDRLAAEGSRIQNFYVASPICSPSRCGLITGQFPARWNITSYLQTRAGNRACEQADFLDPAAPSLPRTLKAAGYATAHIGKWHLGGGRDVTNAPKFSAYGYDLGLGTYESPEPAAPLGLKTTPWGKEREPQQVARHDRTRWMIDQTIAFLDAHTNAPCFVNLWLDDTHTPWTPDGVAPKAMPPEKLAAVISEMDRQIGRLLDVVRKPGRNRETLVLFLGDNGPEPSFERRRTARLRGMKWSLYEGGIRTPFIASWPGKIPAGSVNTNTVFSALDLFPTLCALAGIAPPRGVVFDGEDLSAALCGAQPQRTSPLFWEYGRSPAPVFKYAQEPGAKSPNLAIRDGHWKLLVNSDGSACELYDLAADPNEAINLADKFTNLTTRLSGAALTWRRSMPGL